MDIMKHINTFEVTKIKITKNNSKILQLQSFIIK